MMLFRVHEDLAGSEREAVGEGWKSRRYLLARDGRPFSFHETTVTAGAELRFCYRNHAETVYCVHGRATLEDLASGTLHDIRPGALYVAAPGDDHVLRIEEDTTFVCVFDPPLIGQEEAD